MQQDYNKKISKIQYNLLNLPAALQFTNGNRKDYTYSADGKKLKVVHRTAIANISVPMGQIKELAANQVSQTHTVDYCGNVIYENGSLSKVLTEEGYVTLSGTTPTFYYYLKDHQGNNRMVVRLNGTSWNTEQVNHYYPFGGVFEVNTETSGKQSYKYNEKELDRMHGLDWYDYGARMMDAALGRWHVIDMHAENYYSTSSYAYCVNNPMNYIDPLGTDTISVNNIDQENFDPGKDIVALDEITVTAPLPSLSGGSMKTITQLLKAAFKPSKGGLTAVGRALKKHSDRAGSAFPKATGNQAAVNAQGEKVLKDILGHPSVQVAVKKTRSVGEVLDYQVPGGIGARFSSDGKTFIGFLEPNR